MANDDTAVAGGAGEACFLANLELIEKAISFVCRRYHLNAEQAEEFAAHAKFKLVERDYATLTAFEGRSSLSTFLTVVIQRLFLDYRTSQWGKWRPSAEARRAGPLGVEFETLLTRDGRSFDDACQVMSARHGARVHRDDLTRLADRLPLRTPRRFESDETLAERPASAPGPETQAIAREQQEAADRLSALLSDAVERLAPQDRLIVTLHYVDGRTVAEVARMLGLEQKRLYRHLESVLRDLRTELEKSVLGGAARSLLQDRLASFEWSGSAKPTEKYVSQPSMLGEIEG